VGVIVVVGHRAEIAALHRKNCILKVKIGEKLRYELSFGMGTKVLQVDTGGRDTAASKAVV
jgi:hypothetical protein